MVSERDRAMMARVARDLAEDVTDERGTPEQRRAILEEINADRIDHGIEPLEDRAPEEGFSDRAKSFGMARIDR